MSNLQTTIDTYFAMWNEEDPSTRADLIEQAWAPHGTYVDPLLEADGHAALGTMVDTVHAQFPGHRFRRLGTIDAHHDQARFRWDLTAPDGTVTVAGIDIAVLDDDGRLRSIAGFFGDLPEAEADAA